MTPGDHDTIAQARRHHAAEALDGLVVVAAAFIASEDGGPGAGHRLTADLVEVGRSALTARLSRLRAEEPDLWRAFDGSMIPELVRCAINAMVEAWSSATSAAAPAVSAGSSVERPQPTAPCSDPRKRRPNSH